MPRSRRQLCGQPVATHAPQHSNSAQRRVPRLRRQAVRQRQQVRAVPAAGDRLLAVLRRAPGRVADDHHGLGRAGQAAGEPGRAGGVAERDAHAQYAAVRAGETGDAAVLGGRVPRRQGVGEQGAGGHRQGRAGAARVRRGSGRAAREVRDRGRQRRRRVRAEDRRERDRRQHHEQVVLQGRASGDQAAAGPRGEGRVRSDRAGGRRERHRQGVRARARGRDGRERQPAGVRAASVPVQRRRARAGLGQRDGRRGPVLDGGSRACDGRGRRPGRISARGAQRRRRRRPADGRVARLGRRAPVRRVLRVPAHRGRARPARAVADGRAAGPCLDPVQRAVRRRRGASAGHRRQRRRAHARLERVRRRDAVAGRSAGPSPRVQEARDARGTAHQAHRVHGDGRRAGGPKRVPAGEGDGEGDVQDPRREPVGDGRAERRGPRQEEVGLRGTGTREDHRLLGDHHERRRWRLVFFPIFLNFFLVFRYRASI